MRHEIKVSNEHINDAEQILLREGEQFDDERVAFITDFSTLDLQAVPGSGKTTALLAKLLILERFLPLRNDDGVLVISHTNAAVDEIKRKIQDHCPRLFRYPNFVGTIQSFVDEFLAKPFYSYQFPKKRVLRIDNEIYEEKVESYYQNSLDRTTRYFLRNQREALRTLKNIRLNASGELTSSLANASKPFGLTNPDSPTYKGLEKMKVDILSWGCLHFDDAYFLANRYLALLPKIKTIVRKRFAFVFVDEMQDMEPHQYDLLETLFYDSGNSSSVYQRIGDKNQAIYDGEVSLDNFWQDRNVKRLRGSVRLSSRIAKAVQPFGLHPVEIEGRGRNRDGSEIDVMPKLLVYNDSTIRDVIGKYAEIIRDLRLKNDLPSNGDEVYFAVAWRATSPSAASEEAEAKIALSSYFPPYKREASGRAIDHPNLKSYLSAFEPNKDLRLYRQQLINAFLRALRLKKLRDKLNNDREFSKRRLFEVLKRQKDERLYDGFQHKLFLWCVALAKGEKQTVFAEMKSFLPKFFAHFEPAVPGLIEDPDPLAEFLKDDDSETTAPTLSSEPNPNRIVLNDIEIRVGTVHSVKGQTHTGTLYLESFYERGWGNYESERLRQQFGGTTVVDTLNVQKSSQDKIKKSAKVTFVGFSRPTHLLCFALHEKRFETIYTKSLQDFWDVETV